MAGPITIDATAGGPSKVTLYSWIVFTLTFGLLISDYMARQVLNAVFPLLKAEWQLSDGQLGLLSGIVAIMVGLLTFPLSMAADRWGRVRSLALMAILWSLATLFCAMASGFEQMLVGRALVGIGEAASSTSYRSDSPLTAIAACVTRSACSVRCWASTCMW